MQKMSWVIAAAMLWLPACGHAPKHDAPVPYDLSDGAEGLQRGGLYRLHGKIQLYAETWAIYPEGGGGSCLALGLRTERVDRPRGEYVGDVVGRVETKPGVAENRATLENFSYALLVNSNGFWVSPNMCNEAGFFLAVTELP